MFNYVKNHSSITYVPYLCKIYEVVKNKFVYLGFEYGTPKKSPYWDFTMYPIRGGIDYISTYREKIAHTVFDHTSQH